MYLYEELHTEWAEYDKYITGEQRNEQEVIQTTYIYMQFGGVIKY